MIVTFGDGGGNRVNSLKNKRWTRNLKAEICNVLFIATDCHFQSQKRVVSSFLVWWWPHTFSRDNCFSDHWMFWLYK